MMTESGVDSRVPLPEGKLVIDQGNFLQMMEMLWSAGESIDGREVEMVGFVYNDPSLGQQDFILARLIITCCANDADIAGLLCRWPERQALDEGEWVKVQGKLGRVPYYNLQTHQITNMPFIQVEQLTEVQKPEQEYVYP
jgi:putative membrane protein